MQAAKAGSMGKVNAQAGMQTVTDRRRDPLVPKGTTASLEEEGTGLALIRVSIFCAFTGVGHPVCACSAAASLQTTFNTPDYITKPVQQACTPNGCLPKRSGMAERHFQWVLPLEQAAYDRV